MADRPIIFRAPMVLALLAGSKTQTRQLAWQPRTVNVPGRPTIIATDRSPWQRVTPGDQLWVREAFSAYWPSYPASAPTPGRVVTAAAIKQTDGTCHCASKGEPIHVFYRADCGALPWPHMKYSTPIHMPRWASRLTLTVTEARMQPARDISDADAVAEGVRYWDNIEGYSVTDDGSFYHSGNAGEAWWQFFSHLHRPKSSTGDLTDTLAGRPQWNPEVVALTFTVAACNIDD